MDIVFIRNFTVRTIIGAYDWERQVQQLLIFNVEMAADVKQAAATENLEETVNYSAVGKTIEEVVQKGEYKLVETAAERVAERLMKEYGIQWLRVEVSKPRPYSGGHSVGVCIERGVRD